MASVRERTVHDLLGELPDWQPFDPDCEANVFVASVGFEDRSAECFERWCFAKPRRLGQALLVTYPATLSFSRTQRRRFEEAARLAGVNLEFLSYDRAGVYGQIRGWLHEHVRGRRILVDISSLSSYVFYPVMAAVCSTAAESTLTVCYAEAGHYYPGLEEWNSFTRGVEDIGDPVDRARYFEEHYFQSSGVEQIFESNVFPGMNVDRFPTRLVIVPNFSFERVHQMRTFVVDRYATNRESMEWVFGMPLDQSLRGWRHDALWEMFDQPSNRHTASTFNYKDILVVLHNIWLGKYRAEALVVATAGSKAQHLGTFMFLTMHQDVGLVLSEPKAFATDKFSTGVAGTWQLSLGGVDELTKRLRGWNRVEFTW